MDIYEQRDTIKKDNKVKTFAPPYSAEEEGDIYGHKDDTRKKEKSDFNECGINIDGLDRDGYNINGIDENGLNRDGYNINGKDKDGVDKNGLNINGIEGNRIKYPKKKS